jgi:type I restriction enzyme S subunit
VSWTERPLGEVATLQRGFDLPSQDRRPGSVPIVSSSGPSDVHAVARVAAPGVVTGRYGTIGQVFYVTTPFWPLNTTLWVKDFHGNDPRFVYYLLHTVDFESCNDKSGVPGVNRNDLHRLLIDMPKTLDEQRAIAEVLGALDDKIELNRQMNHTLEDMASALFKSWFVDFDPVVAKAEGRKPFRMDAATAALFPSSFDDAMPRGWTAGSVGDLVELQRGFDLPEPLRSPGKVPVMAAGGFHGYHNKAMVEAPGIVTGRSGKIGDVYWVDSPYWPLNTTLWVKRLLNGAGPAFAYHLLRTLDLAALNVGSAVPSLNRNDVHPLSAVVPSRAVLSRFEETVRDWFALRQQNHAESRTLAALRDALLPKLLSGEVRLKQAEKAVEAAL